MSLTDHLSLPTPLAEKNQTVLAERTAKSLGGKLTQLLSRPLLLNHKRRNSLCLLFLLAAIVWFWSPLTILYSLAQEQEHYSHIILIPWVSLYVLYLKRKEILSSREWSPGLGSVLIGLGVLMYWQADSVSVGTDQLSMILLAFVAICWGIFLLGYGITAFHRVSFGLYFLLFMVPFPSFLLGAIVGLLQRMSTEATDIVFSLLGVPVFRQGFVFSLSNFTIHVAEECSGIRSALALFITAVVTGHFFLRSAWGKAGLLIIVIPMAIVKNAFRIVGLALLANYVDPVFITGSVLHRSGGIPLFLLSLVVLFFLVWLLRKCENRCGYFPLEGMRAQR